MIEQGNGTVSSSPMRDAHVASRPHTDRRPAQVAQRNTHSRAMREVSADGLQQLKHHLRKATEKSANRHVHQALLVLQHMLANS